MALHQSGFHNEAKQMWIYVPKGLPFHKPNFLTSEESQKNGRQIYGRPAGRWTTTHVDQHAYRVGLLTETALHRAVSKILGQLNAKGYTSRELMGIEGAFNYIPREVYSQAAE